MFKFNINYFNLNLFLLKKTKNLKIILSLLRIINNILYKNTKMHLLDKFIKNLLRSYYNILLYKFKKIYIIIVDFINNSIIILRKLRNYY